MGLHKYKKSDARGDVRADMELCWVSEGEEEQRKCGWREGGGLVSRRSESMESEWLGHREGERFGQSKSG